jgi:hypothetical protein
MTLGRPESAGLAVVSRLAITAEGKLPVSGGLAVTAFAQRRVACSHRRWCRMLLHCVRAWLQRLTRPSESHRVAVRGVAESRSVVRALSRHRVAAGRRDLRADVLGRPLLSAGPLLATALVFLHLYRPRIKTE